MFLTEYDEEKHMATERKEHYALGLEDGLARGREEGLTRGREESISKFIETLQELQQPREVIIEKLKEKFSLSAEDVEEYLQMSEENPILLKKN